MNRSLKTRTFWICIVSILMMSGAGAPSAFAKSEKNPEFRWCGKAVSGKFTESHCTTGGAGSWEEFGKLTSESATVGIEAGGSESFEIELPGKTKIKLACKALKASNGSKVFGGEAEGLGGKGEGKLEYEGCELAGSPKCEINGATGESGKATIPTEPLTANLVYENKSAAENELQEEGKSSRVLVWLRPTKENKETKKQTFAEVKLGTGCPIKETIKIETEQNSESHDGILLRVLGEPTAHATQHSLEVITKPGEKGQEGNTFWSNETKVPTQKQVSGLTAFGVPVKTSEVIFIGLFIAVIIFIWIC